jgi:hypothetical protein
VICNRLRYAERFSVKSEFEMMRDEKFEWM